MKARALWTKLVDTEEGSKQSLKQLAGKPIA